MSMNKTKPKRTVIATGKERVYLIYSENVAQPHNKLSVWTNVAVPLKKSLSRYHKGYIVWLYIAVF